MYTSRSAIEAFQDCPRYRYNQYFLNGTGVVAKQGSVPLVTGSAVHRGVEHLLNRVRIGQELDVDTAVALAVEQYTKDCEEQGFRGKDIKTDRQQWFTFCEQRALTEALIRAWALRELPTIQKRYKVLAVEREIEPLDFGNGILFQAKIDAELQEIATGDFHNYSLKTTKEWNQRLEESYKGDLQGVTEIWASEEDDKRRHNRIKEAIERIESVDEYNKTPQTRKIVEYLKVHNPEPKMVMAVRFCYLVKGRRMKPPSQREDPEALMVTYNPLIRGYKNFTPTSLNYAASWTFPNPDNKSGGSKLGKGWEPFNVWESDISIKDWIRMLDSEEIQPECGDFIGQHVVTPLEYFRTPKEMEEAIAEIQLQEERVFRGAQYLTEDWPTHTVLANHFPHYRKHCEFHFGEPCEYKPLCWGNDESVMDLYQIRVPHHKAEKEENETSNQTRGDIGTRSDSRQN